MTALLMPTFDPDMPPPKDDEDWKVAVWWALGSIYREQRKTNGTVRHHQTYFLAALIGFVCFLAGLGVLNLASLLALL